MEKVVDPIAEIVGLVGAAVIAAYRKDGVRRCFRVDYDADELAITLSMLMPAQGRLYSKCIHLFLLDDFCIRAELIAETIAYFVHSKIPDSCEWREERKKNDSPRNTRLLESSFEETNNEFQKIARKWQLALHSHEVLSDCVTMLENHMISQSCKNHISVTCYGRAYGVWASKTVY